MSTAERASAEQYALGTLGADILADRRDLQKEFLLGFDLDLISWETIIPTLGKRIGDQYELGWCKVLCYTRQRLQKYINIYLQYIVGM